MFRGICFCSATAIVGTLFSSILPLLFFFACSFFFIILAYNVILLRRLSCKLRAAVAVWKLKMEERGLVVRTKISLVYDFTLQALFKSCELPFRNK